MTSPAPQMFLAEPPLCPSETRTYIPHQGPHVPALCPPLVFSLAVSPGTSGNSCITGVDL